MRRKASAEAENPFWVTYSDLLSSLFMVSLVLLFAFMGVATVMAQQLKEQNKMLKDKQAQLEAQTRAVDADARSFGSLLKELKELQNEFEDQDVSIDENGDLKIPDTILFSIGGSTLGKKGQDFLRVFIPRYAEVVTKPTYKGIVQGVAFEGHADMNGSSDFRANYFANMTLTSDRAETVNRFVFESIKFKDEDALRRLVTVAGRSNMLSLQELELRAKSGNNPPKGITLPESLPKEWNSLKDGTARKVTIRLIVKNPLLNWKDVQ